MPSRSYIPTTLADRAAWYSNFALYVAANFVALGLQTGDNDVIQAKADAFANAFALAQAAETRTPVTIAGQVAADNDCITTMRFYAGVINATPAVTDEQRAALQITIRAEGPGSKTPIAAPLTWPVLTIAEIGPLLHRMFWRDSSAPTLQVRAKPFGAIGIQLFQYIGATPPSGPEDANFIGNFTRLPVTVNLDPSKIGQTAYYYARWYTARGLEGPLVGPVSATIANS